MSEYRNYDDEWLLRSDNYCKHVSAMTGEKLHSKADIAAELAYRDDLIEQLQQRVDELVDALDHIARVANSSRTQSRRDRWICLRANCAISSSDEWKTADLPKIIENSRGRELRLQAENRELAATVDALREYLRSLVEESTGVVGWHLNGAVADWDEVGATDILGETNDANLNAVKRRVLDDLIKYGCELRHQRWVTNPMNGIERPSLEEINKQGFGLSRSDIEEYKETKYPSVKDGE